jgi:cytochrome b6-f complex iron-sulfur subunit
MFAVAFRRSSSATSDWRDEVQPEAMKADRGGVEVVVLAQEKGEDIPEGDLLTETDEVENVVPAARAVQVQSIIEISPEEAGANRRQFFGKAWAMLFFAYLGTLGLSSLSMMWPVVRGGFGADIDLGDADELLSAVRLPDGSVSPLFWAEARAWIVPASAEEIAGSQFIDNGTVVAGLTAIFMTCVHLGCRVPWCDSSKGFECGCHGSKYNALGEYEAGPAPRNLDRFIVELTDKNRLIAKTGSIINTARARDKSVKYPRGPSCI